MCLLETAYFFFSKFFCNFEELKKNSVNERGGKDSESLTYLETHYVIRTINTIIALGIAFQFGPPDLRTDAVGTHIVENQIGVARSTSTDPRWSRILSSFAYGHLRKILSEKLGLKLYVSKRVNDGGFKLHDDDENMAQKPDWWDPFMLYDLFMSFSVSGFEEAHPHERDTLIAELKKLANDTKIKIVNSSEVAGSQIIARLLKFKGNITPES